MTPFDMELLKAQTQKPPLEKVEKLLMTGAITPVEAVNASFEHRHAVRVGDIKRWDPVEKVPCGFSSMDEFSIFKKGRGQLIVLAARPGMGKTALMGQLAINMSKHGRVLFFSMEIEKEAVVERMDALCSATMLDKLAGVVPIDPNSQNIVIDDRAPLGVSQIASEALSWAQDGPLSLVLIDHLGLIPHTGTGASYEEITKNVVALKALTKELKCPIMVASPVNRSCEKNGKSKEGFGDFMPSLSDLSGSSGVEGTADSVLAFVQPSIHDQVTRPGDADFKILKHRSGRVGSFTLRFNGIQYKFSDPKDTLKSKSV